MESITAHPTKSRWNVPGWDLAHFTELDIIRVTVLINVAFGLFHVNNNNYYLIKVAFTSLNKKIRIFRHKSGHSS